MSDYKLGAMELRFADLIWHNEPISSGELVKLCAEELEWKKSTTYTMLKRLVEKGMIQRRDPGFHCYALVSREQVQQEETRSLIDKVYNGSRRLFLSSFLSREKLTHDEIDEIEKIIEANK